MKIGLTLPNRVEHLLAYRRLGFSEVTLRITSWDQEAQFQRLVGEVLPALEAAP